MSLRVVVAIVLMLFVQQVAWAEESADLAGPAFSSSRKVVDLSKEWQEQPIVHDASLEDVDLVVNLDQSEYPFLHTVINEYGKKNGLNIFVNSGTCGISSQMLRHKTIDVAAFCCPPGKGDYLPDVTYTTLGVSPLLIIVHPDNPIESLTVDEVRYAFSGDLRRWSEVGTSSAAKNFDHPIQPLAFIHCKKRPGHWRLILGNEDLFSARLQTVLTVPEMIQSVASLKNAIGYEVPALVDHYEKERGQVRYVKVDGYDPANLETLAKGNYPFYRTFSLATWNKKGNAEAQKLVDFLITYFATEGPAKGFLPVQSLRDAGWQFEDKELVGAPVQGSKK